MFKKRAAEADRLAICAEPVNLTEKEQFCACVGVPEKAHAVVVSVIRAGRNAPAQVARSKLPGGEVLVSVTEADCPVFKPLFETAV